MCWNRARYYNGEYYKDLNELKALSPSVWLLCTGKAQNNNPLTRVIKVFPLYLQNLGKNIAIDTEPGQNQYRFLTHREIQNINIEATLCDPGRIAEPISVPRSVPSAMGI